MVLSLHCLSLGLSWLGYPDRAWAKSRGMLEVAQRSSNPEVLAQAFNFLALHHLRRGDSVAAQKYAEEAMALVEERGFVRLFGDRDDLVWRCSDRSRALRGGRRRNAPGLCRLARYWRNAAGFLFFLSGHRARRNRTARRRTSGTGGGICFRCENRRASQQDQICITLKVDCCWRGTRPTSPKRAMFPHGDRNRPAAKCEIRGVARHDEPRPAARDAGPPRRGARDARRNLRLVHRGLRHR